MSKAPPLIAGLAIGAALSTGIFCWLRPAGGAAPGRAEAGAAAPAAATHSPTRAGDGGSAPAAELPAKTEADRALALKKIGVTARSAADRRRKTIALLQDWALEDPRAAARLFEQLSPTEKAWTAAALAEAWAEKDAPAATQWAEALPRSNARNAALSASLAKLVEADPTGALAVLDRLDPASSRAVSSAVFAAWTEHDPEAAVPAALQRLEGGKLPDAAARAVASKWAAIDPAAALEWVAKNTGRSALTGANFAASLVSAAAGIDPKSAVESMSALKLESQDVALHRASAMRAWLQSDPAAARAWFSQLSADSAVQLVSSGLKFNADATNAQSWLPLVESLQAGAGRDQAYRTLMKDWSVNDPEAALRYLSASPDPQLKSSLMPVVIQGLASTDPELALATAQQLAAGSDRQQTLSTIANRWATANPTQAIERIMTMQEGPDRQVMLPTAAYAYAVSDPKGAASWVLAQPPSVTRDNILSSVALGIAKTNPDLAILTAEAISTASFRKSIIDRLPKKKG